MERSRDLHTHDSPSENVDQNHETIDRDDFLHGPVSISRKKRKRTPEDHFERRGMDGRPPTKRQQAALDALRHYTNAERNGELPELNRCLGGSSLLRIYAEGGAYRYSFKRPPEMCARSRAERSFWSEKLDPTEWLALELVLGVQLLQHAQALMVRYDDLVPILGLDYDTVGKVMRKLVRLEYVAHLPMHRCLGRRKHLRAANVYWVTERGLERLGIGARPRIAPPPAPGMRAAKAMVEKVVASAVNVAQAIDRNARPDHEIHQLDRANPDPTEFHSLGDQAGVSGELVREASIEGGLAPLAGEFIRIASPDESSLRLEAANRVKARPEALSGSGGEGFDVDDSITVDESTSSPELIGDLVPRATVAALIERAEVRGRRRGHRNAFIHFECENRRRDHEAKSARREAKQALQRTLGELAIERGRGLAAAPTPDVLERRLGLISEVQRAQLEYLEQARSLGVASKVELEQLDRLQALEEREAKMDEGAAAAPTTDDDETGGDS